MCLIRGLNQNAVNAHAANFLLSVLRSVLSSKNKKPRSWKTGGGGYAGE